MVRTCKRIKTKLQKKTLGVVYKKRHFLNKNTLFNFHFFVSEQCLNILLFWGRANINVINISYKQST